MKNFEGPIRDWVHEWTKTFDANSLAGRIAKSYEDDLKREASDMTADLKEKARLAEKAVIDITAKMADQINKHADEVAKLRAQIDKLKKDNADVLYKFQDVEARHNAFIRSRIPQGAPGR